MSATMDGVRIPPHSVEAERALLGGLLLLNSAFDRVGDLVDEGDFYGAGHRAMWRALLRLFDANKPADVLTLGDALRASGDLEQAGGLAYLHQLATGTPSAANVRRYAEIVRERSACRAVIEAASSIMDEAYAAQPAADLIERAQAAMFGLSERRAEHEPSGMGAVLSRVMAKVDERHRGEDHRIPTGLLDLDRMLHGGLRAGRLYVIGGRPSSGKSALALQIAQHAALNGHPAMVASMEMADEENGERAIAAAAKVELDKIITGQLAPDDWDRMSTALAELNDAPLYFDDTPAQTLPQLRARVRRMRHRRRIEVLVVDYVQLMRASARGENRNLEVGEFAEGLKALARELGIAVIALSQMNRKCEERTNRRGIVADLRDSGGIDAAADFIAFVYRDDMYNPDSPAHGVAEIIVRKARQGRIGTVYTIFQGEFSRFENAAPGFVPMYTEPTQRRLPPARKSFVEAD